MHLLVDHLVQQSRFVLGHQWYPEYVKHYLFQGSLNFISCIHYVCSFEYLVLT